MKREHRIVIEHGEMRFVYDDDLATLAHDGEVVRASHVEPASTFGIPGGGWIADMTPVGGPWLTAEGPVDMDTHINLTTVHGFTTRQEALDAERQWLREEMGL